MKSQNLTILVILYTASIAASYSKFRAAYVRASGVCDEYPSQIIYLPVPGDCRMYVECYYGSETLLQCPDGLWWRPDVVNCDFPGDYCTNATTSTTTTTTTVTTTTTDPTTTTTATTTTTDPTTTTTDPTTTTTDPTTTTTATTATTKSTTNTTPTTPGHGTDPRCLDGSPSYWPHPAFCHRFIECYDGDSYEMQCPPGLFFSDAAKKCVDAELSECCASTTQCQ